MDIYVNGTIVDSEDAWVYDLFGIENASPEKIRDALKEADGSDVDIFINSGGGSVFAGSEIYSAIQRYKGNVTIHVTGLAASAASVVACAGKCLMSATAQMMVHNVSSYGSGDYKNFDKMSEILKKANEAIAAAYVQKSGMSMQDALELMDVEKVKELCDELEPFASKIDVVPAKSGIPSHIGLEFQTDTLILDDGFQYLNLKAHINILLVDSTFPFDNHHVLPRGLMREPISDISRADYIFLTKSNGSP